MILLNYKAFSTQVLFIFFMLFLTACSQTNNKAYTASSASSFDPYEKTNRHIFKFNAGLDKHFVKPVASAYKAITPEIVDHSVSNFFNNLDDVGSAVNSLLQAKPGPALMDTERVLFNSTIGLGGLFDVASVLGMDRYDEDFGQTLAHWGVKSGPYVMLPFFGPSTIRDATAKFTVDSLMNPVNYHDEKVAFTALRLLDKRADLFNDEEAFKDLSEDQYSALRDLWLQRRASMIRDGKGDTQEQSDLIDELEALDNE